MYAVTLNLIQFQEKRFKVYRPCETNTHPFSSRLDIIVLSITTELTARVFLRSFFLRSRSIVHLFVYLFRKRRRNEKERKRHRFEKAGSRCVAFFLFLYYYYYYLSSPSITARLRLAIWRSSKIKARGGMKKGWRWVCPRKCRLCKPAAERRGEWMPLCMPRWSGINTSFLQAL